jgi:endonuclease/exonuclease/phosphatase family metal-dependent hydrolase
MKTLKLLTYNIQTGVGTASSNNHVSNLWQQIKPHKGRHVNLKKVATMLSEYDVVALQELDMGSVRSRQVDQLQYLCEHGGFDYGYCQITRNAGKLAQFAKGILSKTALQKVEQHKLPGLPGRGILMAEMGDKQPVLLINVHLALGPLARTRQLHYIKKLVHEREHVIVMGDFNATPHWLMHHSPLSETSLQPANMTTPTYPAWRPTKKFDTIFTTPGIKVVHSEILECNYSDHLPVAVEIVLPVKE